MSAKTSYQSCCGELRVPASETEKRRQLAELGKTGEPSLAVLRMREASVL